MDLLKKSVSVLKSLQLKNGAILSTPMEQAYPYVYPRDAVIITKGLNKAGLYKNSERFYHFLKRNSRIDIHKEIFQRYNSEGLPCVTRKHEHDNTGLVLHGIYDTYLHGKNISFLENMWPFVNKCMEFLLLLSRNHLIKTKRSIHEFYRLEHGFEIWANCASCRGLYDAALTAKALGQMKECTKWLTAARRLEKNIRKSMFNKTLGIFVKNTRYPNLPDISQLSPFYFDLVDSKIILRKTMDYLRKTIWHESLGGFKRFRKFEVCKDWHWYTGGSGSWSFAAIWAARFYKILKDKNGYEDCISWINKTASRTNGLFPEHVSLREDYEEWKKYEIEFNDRIVHGMKDAELLAEKFNEKIIYWATPLGWPHAEYVMLMKKLGQKKPGEDMKKGSL